MHFEEGYAVRQKLASLMAEKIQWWEKVVVAQFNQCKLADGSLIFSAALLAIYIEPTHTLPALGCLDQWYAFADMTYPIRRRYCPMATQDHRSLILNLRRMRPSARLHNLLTTKHCLHGGNTLTPPVPYRAGRFLQFQAIRPRKLKLNRQKRRGTTTVSNNKSAESCLGWPEEVTLKYM